jgi:hypothetical protein
MARRFISDIFDGYFQRYFPGNIRFILRIGPQATEPAILWFERRIHRVKLQSSSARLGTSARF